MQKTYLIIKTITIEGIRNSNFKSIKAEKN
jgi:hypothetical protein